jgi:hypothetical protein
MGMGGGMGGMGGGMGGGAISQRQAAAFLQTPQGRAMIDQMVANPAQFLQMLPPEARNAPEVQALLRDPAMLRERLQAIVMQSMMQGDQEDDDDEGGGHVPRDIFDLAMECMNGAEIPQEYRFEVRFQDGSGRPAGGRFGDVAMQPAAGGAGAAAEAHREYVSREAINAALDACIRDGLIPDVPRAEVGGSAAEDSRSEAGFSDTATAGSAVGSVADVAESMEEDDPVDASAAGGGGAGGGASQADGDAPMSVDADTPAARYAEQLAQLKEMGFDNEQACVAALEAAGGDVNSALAFLS